MKTRYQYYVTVILFVFTTLLLSACGGSDSSSDDSSTSPPASTYTVGGTVTGLSSSGLVLQNNGDDDLEVAGVSFEFVTELTDGSVYDVTVLTQPTGQRCDVTHGNGAVNGANVSDVTVNCIDWWGKAELIEIDDGDAEFPQIAIDDDGNALAVWKQQDDNVWNIWANRYSVGSGWGTAEKIETNIGQIFFSPQIAMDADGNALAVWGQLDDILDKISIWSNRYTAGTGWGMAELIETNDFGTAYNPQIAMNAAGNAFAVWGQWDASQANIWANRYTAGSGWGTAEKIDTNPDMTVSSQITIDAAGNALAVWSQLDNSQGTSIWSNRYTVGNGWGVSEWITINTGSNADYPQIDMNAAGDAFMVWWGSDGNLSKRYTAGSGWGVTEKIETDHLGPASTPQIAIDAAGNALAVGGLNDDGFWSSRYTVGNGWDTAEKIETDDHHVSSPQIDMNAAGNAFIVWWDTDGIWSNYYAVGSGWGMSGEIDSSTGHGQSPQVSINTDGTAMAVWSQYDGAKNNIWANRFE